MRESLRWRVTWDKDTETRVAPRPRQAEEGQSVVSDGFADGLFGPVLEFVAFPKAAGDEMQGDHDRVR